MHDKIVNLYFEWLYNFVCVGRYRRPISYRKLLMFLHDTEFISVLPMDKNRAEDGMSLRYQFLDNYVNEYPTEKRNANDILDILYERPCSVLEMMVALAVRCENTIMDDPQVGNRTGQWFWGMITNLGLGAMIDSEFDKDRAKEAVNRLLYREYDPDGRGGLFRIRNCKDDVRNVDIWCQLCWYLDSIS